MKIIKIGTRDSELALWQANTVSQLLQDLGYETQVIPIKSTGDIVLDKPLYELGITGIFTKALDVAMLNKEVDIAVHSLKDVPTKLPYHIEQMAVLPRATTLDIMVYKPNGYNLEKAEVTLATSSLRRKAQWLNRYPTHHFEDIRGNVNTRLRKLNESNWEGAIFAAAGLERINLKPETFINLDWMIPAPAQGAMQVVVNKDNDFAKEAVAKLNDKNTEICTTIERQFLSTLEGGCTAPIGALATLVDDEIQFIGGLFSLDGKQKVVIEKSIRLAKMENIGQTWAKEVLEKGGREIMDNMNRKG
jgi:hydroxymethylbilane synthase